MNYLQESQFRRIPGPNGVGIAVGALLGIFGGSVFPPLAVIGAIMFFLFVFREHAESKSAFRRAETHAPALMEQIRGVTREAFLQAPDQVRDNLERGLAENIKKLEEITLGLRSEADDPSANANRQEQAAIKFAMLLKNLAEAHAKYTDLTARVLPSRVLKRPEAPTPAPLDPALST
ncbi:MAG: hypothetical protein L0210_08720 [Rhodospirillales bacterium]|nr:hypothetical protein [Rhodospirillales bacterium]